jgi:hypothetical protein
MTTESLLFAQILRRLAKKVEGMDSAEMHEFLRDFDVKNTPRKSRETSFDPRLKGDKSQPYVEINEILSRLQTAPDRETGAMLLRELSLSRRHLLELARSRSVHITKEDSLRRIEEKLIEAIIGAKLNSQAIRGKSNGN